VGIAVDGANRHDMKMLEHTLKSIPVNRPVPTWDAPQYMCMDKGYDYPQVRQLLEQWGYTAKIVPRGQEAAQKQKLPGYRARRWVVERTHSWMNRFRRLLIRWEKNLENYAAFLHLACGWITLRAARRP
jgi:putative transposase